MQRSRVTVLPAVVVATLSFISTGLVQAETTPRYTVTKTVALGAPDRWDYVVFDASSHRVYVAHGDRVTVVDSHDGTLIGQVEGYPGGTHGIGISTSTGKGYTDDGRAGTVGAFSLKTLKTEKTIKAAEDADGIIFDPASRHVFVINGDSATITVIDPKADTAIATINGGGKLEFAVADGHGKLYVNGAEKKEIVRVDTGTNQVDAHWAIANCTSPHGLAIDAATHRLFSSCVNNVLVVINTDTGATVATLPIGSGTDAAAFDPKRKLIFSSNGRDGTLSVILEKDANTFVSLGDIKTSITARTMAIDPDTGRLYLAAGNIDPHVVGPNGRPQTVPGSLKLLFLDPMP